MFGLDTDINVGGNTRKATSGFEALNALNTNGGTAFKQVRLWRAVFSQTGDLTLAKQCIVNIGLPPCDQHILETHGQTPSRAQQFEG